MPHGLNDIQPVQQKVNKLSRGICNAFWKSFLKETITYSQDVRGMERDFHEPAKAVEVDILSIENQELPRQALII